MSDVLITVIVGLVLAVGLLGTVVPVLPGILLMWVGVVGYGFFVGFDVAAIIAIALVTVLSAASVALGVIIPKQFADESGATLTSQIAAVLGGIIGFFVIPVVGILVGALIGIAIAEYLDKEDFAQARASTIAVAKGFGLSALLQIAFGFAIFIVWAGWAASVLIT